MESELPRTPLRTATRRHADALPDWRNRPYFSQPERASEIPVMKIPPPLAVRQEMFVPRTPFHAQDFFAPPWFKPLHCSDRAVGRRDRNSLSGSLCMCPSYARRTVSHSVYRPHHTGAGAVPVTQLAQPGPKAAGEAALPFGARTWPPRTRRSWAVWLRMNGCWRFRFYGRTSNSRNAYLYSLSRSAAVYRQSESPPPVRSPGWLPLRSLCRGGRSAAVRSAAEYYELRVGQTVEMSETARVYDTPRAEVFEGGRGAAHGLVYELGI
jgi:hypothetical protein